MGSSTEMLQFCRLCLVKERVNTPIFDVEGDLSQVFLKITACLPVKISKNDKLPKKICDCCTEKVDNFYQFWNQSASSEKQLLEWLHTGTVENGTKLPAKAHSSSSNVPVFKQEVIDDQDNDATIESIDVSNDTQSYILQQQQLPYQPVEFFDEGGFTPEQIKVAGPPATVTSKTPLRRKRGAAPPQTAIVDDDDDVALAKLAKTESVHVECPAVPTTFVGVTDNEQPGPSGIGKVSAEAPSQLQTVSNLQNVPDVQQEEDLFAKYQSQYNLKEVSVAVTQLKFAIRYYGAANVLRILTYTAKPGKKGRKRRMPLKSASVSEYSDAENSKKRLLSRRTRPPTSDSDTEQEGAIGKGTKSSRRLRKKSRVIFEESSATASASECSDWFEEENNSVGIRDAACDKEPDKRVSNVEKTGNSQRSNKTGTANRGLLRLKSPSWLGIATKPGRSVEDPNLEIGKTLGALPPISRNENEIINSILSRNDLINLELSRSAGANQAKAAPAGNRTILPKVSITMANPGQFTVSAIPQLASSASQTLSHLSRLAQSDMMVSNPVPSEIPPLNWRTSSSRVLKQLLLQTQTVPTISGNDLVESKKSDAPSIVNPQGNENEVTVKKEHFYCDICFDTFLSEAALKSHTELHALYSNTSVSRPQPTIPTNSSASTSKSILGGTARGCTQTSNTRTISASETSTVRKDVEVVESRRIRKNVKVTLLKPIQAKTQTSAVPPPTNKSPMIYLSTVPLSNPTVTTSNTVYKTVSNAAVESPAPPQLLLIAQPSNSQSVFNFAPNASQAQGEVLTRAPLVLNTSCAQPILNPSNTSTKNLNLVSLQNQPFVLSGPTDNTTSCSASPNLNVLPIQNPMMNPTSVLLASTSNSQIDFNRESPSNSVLISQPQVMGSNPQNCFISYYPNQ